MIHTLWMMLIGLGLFLYGMAQLETGIRGLGHHTFKRILSRSTDSPLTSAAAGIGVTAILQSSSLVSLLVLAFASAGVLPLYNAIGIVLGANLGTTMTGWIVTALGFKLSLQAFAVPLMGLGAISQLIWSRQNRIKSVGLAAFGLGLIIFGLDIMKGAVEELPQQWDVSLIQGYGPLVYFLFGAVMASLIQSSSAVMMISLSALHGGILDLPAAAALVIGADLGTTSTTVLGSIGGSVVKRQLALAHCIFNAVVDFCALFFLLPLLGQLQQWFSVYDPLFSLVLFHSSFNFLGLLVFLPMLKKYSDWIASCFLEQAAHERPLEGVSGKVPEAALPAIDNALERLLYAVIALDLHNFRLTPEDLHVNGDVTGAVEEHFEQRMEFEDRYEDIKQQESDILELGIALQAEPLESEQADMLLRRLDATRSLVYSAKTLKDIRENLVSLRHHQQTEITALFKSHQKFLRKYISRCLRLKLAAGRSQALEEKVAELNRLNQQHYEEANATVHQLVSNEGPEGGEISTLLNVNHELHHAMKHLAVSVS